MNPVSFSDAESDAKKLREELNFINSENAIKHTGESDNTVRGREREREKGDLFCLSSGPRSFISDQIYLMTGI